MTHAVTALLVSASVFLLAACGKPASNGADRQPAQSAPVIATVSPPSAPRPDASLAPVSVPPSAGSTSPLGRAIEQATWPPTSGEKDAMRNVLIRAQVLLAQAHFSPGVIDGQPGENMKNALMAYEGANGLPQDGALKEQVWNKLVQHAGPVTSDYTLTYPDVAGPFAPQIPTDYDEMAKLDRLSYSSPIEALAERFHMDEALLAALNPGVDFNRAGSTILVVSPGGSPLQKIARIEVNKSRKQVLAYGADGQLAATYPASIGSADLPSPSGSWAVRAIAEAPTWTYDPSRLSFGDRSGAKKVIAAGPNNPVGAVWIDLTKDTYGIHGSPDPRLVGKRASHGCVRLTNWDARELANAVSKGVPVIFVEAGPPTRA